MNRTLEIDLKFAQARTIKPDLDEALLRHAYQSGASPTQAASMFLNAVLRICCPGDGLDPQSPFLERVPAGTSVH
jgi:hypothetical protein